MPIYEYRCTHCGHQFEVMHAVDGAPPRCERCGREVRRVFSPVGIIFKGPGFHVNDYRKTPAPSDGASKAAEKAPADGGKRDDGKVGSAASSDGAKSNPKPSKSASRSGGGGTVS
ncbi:MAG TPA: FmdB family zinc ribbon protein [bacterium]|nr:FmdB family zinc ribbon protein [bacterium]